MADTPEPTIEALTATEAVTDAIESLVEAADEELLLAADRETVTGLEPVLSAAVDRGVLVLLAVYGDDATDGTERPDAVFDGMATIVRQGDPAAASTSMASVDRRTGLIAPSRSAHVDAENYGTLFTDPNLEHLSYVFFMSQVWDRSTEVYVAPPHDLPREYASFRNAVVQATLHLRERTGLRARIEAFDAANGREVTLDGDVVNARQKVVYPDTSGFAGETSLTLTTPEGRVTVGGQDAYVEDYVARRITLYRSDGE